MMEFIMYACVMLRNKHTARWNALGAVLWNALGMHFEQCNALGMH